MNTRFELRTGKFGMYFYDKTQEVELPLDVVLTYLNCSEFGNELPKDNPTLSIEIDSDITYDEIDALLDEPEKKIKGGGVDGNKVFTYDE